MEPTPSEKLQAVAKKLVESYINGKTSLEQIVRLEGFNPIGYGYLMLQVASHLPDSDELHLRKSIAYILDK